MSSHQTCTWMGRIGLAAHHATVRLVCCLLLVQCLNGSEFPERECCDPIYPLIPEQEPFPPALPTTTISSSLSPYAVGAGGVGAGVLQGRSGELKLFSIRWTSAEGFLEEIKKFTQFNSSWDSRPQSIDLLSCLDIEFQLLIQKSSFLDLSARINIT